jgi:hypothetical protein
MLCFVRTFIVLCTAVSAFGASSLHGKVLCFGDGGHAALEPPHTDSPCGATHEAHEPAGSGHDRHERDCSDVSADFLTLRDGPADTVDVTHFDAALLPPPLDIRAAALMVPQLRLGLRTFPPSDAQRACLRSIVLLV